MGLLRWIIRSSLRIQISSLGLLGQICKEWFCSVFWLGYMEHLIIRMNIMNWTSPTFAITVLSLSSLYKCIVSDRFKHISLQYLSLLIFSTRSQTGRYLKLEEAANPWLRSIWTGDATDFFVNKEIKEQTIQIHKTDVMSESQNNNNLTTVGNATSASKPPQPNKPDEDYGGKTARTTKSSLDSTSPNFPSISIRSSLISWIWALTFIH
jgi:hypothetical protein